VTQRRSRTYVSGRTYRDGSPRTANRDRCLIGERSFGWRLIRETGVWLAVPPLTLFSTARSDGGAAFGALLRLSRSRLAGRPPACRWLKHARRYIRDRWVRIQPLQAEAGPVLLPRRCLRPQRYDRRPHLWFRQPPRWFVGPWRSPMSVPRATYHVPGGVVREAHHDLGVESNATREPFYAWRKHPTKPTSIERAVGTPRFA
jgi:hypothetical protein